MVKFVCGEQYGAVFVSDTLLSVDIPVVSDYMCNIAYGGTEESPVVYPSMMCAGNITEGNNGIRLFLLSLISLNFV